MAAGNNLTIRHVFNAPRSVVWELWTDPKHLRQWWGPDGFASPACEVDVRDGGLIHIDLQAPDGTIYPMSGVFREVAMPERLVFTASPLDKIGNKAMEVLHTVIFKELGDKTELTLQTEVLHTTPQAAPFLAGMEAGWRQSLKKLNSLLHQVTKGEKTNGKQP